MNNKDAIIHLYIQWMFKKVMEDIMSSYERDLGCMEVNYPVLCTDGTYVQKTLEVCDDFNTKCVPALQPTYKARYKPHWTTNQKRHYLEKRNILSAYDTREDILRNFDTVYFANMNVGDAQEKKETDMRNDIALNVVSTPGRDLDIEARDRLLTRVTEIYRAKDKVLEDKYFITAPQGPKTLGELKERLAKGQFTIDSGKRTDDYEIECWMSLDHWLSWRLKGQEKDQAGYEKAHKALKDLREKIKDLIYTSLPADGLKALQDFETAKIQ